MDDDIVKLKLAKKDQEERELQDLFYQKVDEWFPDVDYMEVMCEVYPDTDDLIVCEVLEEQS